MVNSTAESSSNTIDHNHLLYLQPSNSPGVVQTGILLIGMENYSIWSRVMLLALECKNKLEFIDGTVRRDTIGKDLEKQWDRCNALVKSWITSNVSKELLSGILFRPDAYSDWNDLKEKFDMVNLTRSYHLHKEVSTLTQGVSPVSVYYSKLKDLWDETDYIMPVPSCCDKSKDFVTHLTNQRLLKFLMGLNDGYSQARSQILMMSPTPSVNQAFALIA
ncbi:uncharacterized protein LOC142176766 [Nicotiana tabacum]|uniref:Uncharacterized protein LOC142176766 n=1 Tax=Nicotiana tabacum TaxID=4097 RepID=A0AC58TVA6_TOBAC